MSQAQTRVWLSVMTDASSAKMNDINRQTIPVTAEESKSSCHPETKLFPRSESVSMSLVSISVLKVPQHKSLSTTFLLKKRISPTL